jgi:Nuclease-related domain
MASHSPLKARPLRIPGESLDKEIDDLVMDSGISYFIVAAMLCGLAGFEWLGYLTHSPRQPILFSTLAIVAVGITAWQIMVVRKKVRSLRLGRDGERVVGQFLERLRGSGGQVFHDIPGKDFNLDHVVIHGQGIYAIETKTFSKPWPKANITIEGDTLRVAGRVPDRDPIKQARAAAGWLSSKLEELTGRKFPVRGVVVFPGWFVEQPSERGPVWVLEPKMLPAYIERESVTITPADVALASAQLSRYVRAEVERNS